MADDETLVIADEIDLTPVIAKAENVPVSEVVKINNEVTPELSSALTGA